MKAPGVSSTGVLNDRENLTALGGAVALLNRVALRSGKKFRAHLLCWTGEALGLSTEKLQAYATLAERLHNATLFHDDVIDESPTRRGKPTLNANGENQKAVLAGDLLLAVALKEVSLHASSLVLTEVFDVLVALVEGEWLQLEARREFDVDERHLRSVAEKKTASLISWCVYTPGRLASLSPTAIQQLRIAGHHLGVAFQMADDCLDFKEASGKPWGQDIREGQINFVTHKLKQLRPSLNIELKQLLNNGLTTPPSQAFAAAALEVTRLVKKDVLLELEACREALGSLSELKPVLQTLENNVFAPFAREL